MNGLVAPMGDLFGQKGPDGFILRPSLADTAAQMRLLEDLYQVVTAAPLHRVMTKTGGYTSAAITNCGSAGWWSDRRGYRYEPLNPGTGKPWPPIPASFLAVTQKAVAESPWSGFEPDACLINFYEPGAKMGLHQDRDERDFSQPIVTVCLGDDADFLMGGAKRSDKTTAFVVKSGDVMVMGGNCRLFYHGVRRIYSGTSPWPDIKGRFSLTLRKAL
jgi:alkylated DNA repair protein (DNA oxidative demethylase)